MTANQRAEFVFKTLNKLYPEPGIPLNHKDEFTLLIAVLLSAQCTDERVNKVTPGLFAKASTPQQMVKLSVEEIKAFIRPCGLSPQKSKAIHRLSQILIEQYNGKVPKTFAELEELPGVGHKTASVVMAQAFGSRPFRWIPIFTVWRSAGALARVKVWLLRSGRLKKPSPKSTGTSSICRLFITGESIAKLAIVTASNASSAELSIPIEKERLRPKSKRRCLFYNEYFARIRIC